MPRKATTALAALVVFGTASVVLADTNNRPDYHGLFAQRPVSMMSNGRTGVVNDAGKPFTPRGRLVRASQPLRTECPVLSWWHHKPEQCLDQID
jgi:hypothetical protein